MRWNDLSKQKFGRLQPLKKIGTKHDCALWLCGCRCGNYTKKSSGELTRRTAPRTSCGFCQDHIKYPKEYIAWRNMKGRCDNPKDKSYKYYGAKGIKVAEYFREDFFNFLEHVGLAPSSEHTIDRIKSTKNYEPGNIRWATRTIQSLNRDINYTLESRLKLKYLMEQLRSKPGSGA
jgi:hypothetical protein